MNVDENTQKVIINTERVFHIFQRTFSLIIFNSYKRMLALQKETELFDKLVE